ncbi:MFS transporter [Streptomyces sp. NPDC014889]|uniref:MFS transporter n=1 Tax=Streptomyces sp. NPDC014889 TaxID=3364928 RepID=UPI00370276D8
MRLRRAGPGPRARSRATVATASRGDRAFWCLWCATGVSGLGDGVRFAAFALFAAVLTSDPLPVALVTVAGQLPWLCVGPFAGVLVDRFDRRRTLWICDVARAAVMVCFSVLTLLGHVDIATLTVTTFLLSSIETLADNLSQAITPEVIGSRSLDSANSWLFGGQFITSEFLGAPLGTLLFSMAYALPFTVDAVTFVLSAVLILGIRGSGAGPPPRTARPVVTDMADGIRRLLRHRVLRPLCLLMGMLNFAVLGVLGIAVLYALEVLRVSQTTYGLLLTVIAVGGLIGLFVAPALAARIGHGRTLLVAFALCPLPLAIGGVTSNPLVAALALLFVGVSVSLGNVVTTTVRQTLIPPDMFGRMNAAYRLFVNGLAPLGAFAGGIVAQQYSLRAPFYVAAVVCVLLVVAAPRLLRDLPEPTAAARTSSGERS